MRTTIILMVAVAGLGTYLFFSGYPASRDERSIVGLRQLFGFDTASVQSLRVDAGGTIVLLEKTGGEWRLNYPVQGAADHNAVLLLLERLDGLRWTQRITPRDQAADDPNDATYGFASPRATITLESDGASLTMLIGRDTPGGEEIYMKRSDLDDIFVTGRAAWEALPDSVAAWRDRRLLRIAPDRVTRIEWQLRDGPLRLVRGDDDQWFIEQPGYARANSMAIRQWLNRMYEFRIHDFVAESMAAASLYGLDAPSRTLTVQGETVLDRQVLMTGHAADRDGVAYYAALQGQQQVFSMLAAAAKWMEPSRLEFRDYRLVPWSAAGITEIEMYDDEQSVKLNINTQGVWEVTAPRRFIAHAPAVEAMLEPWLHARALQFIDPPPADLTPYGLQVTSRHLRLTRALPASAPAVVPRPADRDFKLIIGNTLDGESFYARASNSEALIELPASLLQAFTVSPLAFRDPVVLAIEPATVERISQESMLETNTVERVGAIFRGSAPGLIPDTGAINGLLALLERLTTTRFIEESSRNLSAYGLDNPAARIVIGLSSPTLNRVLLIGAPADEHQRYAMRQGIDVVFTLPETVIAALLKPVANSIAPVTPPPAGAAPE